jgi:hypothetical protein
VTRYLLRSLNVLNGLLLAALAATIFEVLIPSLEPVGRMPLPLFREPAATAAKTERAARHLASGDYAVISEKNLFHPERKVPQAKPVEKAVARPDIFLNGTLITDEGRFAFIEDRKAPPAPVGGRGKRQLTLRKGATLGGYLLSEVEADRIVLVKGDDRFVVTLTDREKRLAVERAAPPAAAPSASRAAAGGFSAAPPVSGSVPKTTASPEPGSELIVPRSPLVPGPPFQAGSAAPSTQTEPGQGPGIGGTGIWPPTRSTVEQTRQKLLEAQQIRQEQLRKNK